MRLAPPIVAHQRNELSRRRSVAAETESRAAPLAPIDYLAGRPSFVLCASQLLPPALSRLSPANLNAGIIEHSLVPTQNVAAAASEGPR